MWKRLSLLGFIALLILPLAFADYGTEINLNYTAVYPDGGFGNTGALFDNNPTTRTENNGVAHTQLHITTMNISSISPSPNNAQDKCYANLTFGYTFSATTDAQGLFQIWNDTSSTWKTIGTIPSASCCTRRDFWYNQTICTRAFNFTSTANNADGGIFFLNGTVINNPNSTDVSPLIYLSVNNTSPRINDMIMFNITANSSQSGSPISSITFFWNNGTGSTFYNDSTIFLTQGVIANTSVIKTIQNISGTTIFYRAYTNDSAGRTTMSGTFSFVVAGNISPSLSQNPNNFFNTQNTSIISLNQSQRVLLNISLSDDIDLFAIEVNITNQNGVLITNFSNQSLSGTNFTFEKYLNVTGSQGFYNVSIEVTDSHTAKEIPDWKVSKLVDTLVFDKHLTIRAEGAIWADTEKTKDRYSFDFTYLPLVAPKTKTFIIESNEELKLVTTSGYKAHFVDEINSKWIDFEGLEGTPTIEKLNDKSYKITFQNEGNKVKFNSIGGLNRNVFYYQYYLSNASIQFYQPENNINVFGQDQILVSFNVTGNGKNTTTIKLSNSSYDVVQTAIISNTGTGTYFYNTTFTGTFLDSTYYVNATHTDVNRENSSSLGKTFYNLLLSQTIGYPAINYTILDEVNNSRISGTVTGTYTYNGTNPVKEFDLSSTNTDNFSVNIFPAFESILTDYTITYSATGYVQRQFNKNDAVLTNATQTQVLYLLSENNGIYGTFRVIDSFENALSGVLIQMKNSNGDVLESQTTDDAGVASFWVNPDTTYIFVFTLQGYLIKTSSLRITTSDIVTVILESEESEQEISYFTGLSYDFTPKTTLQNQTLYTFNFNLTSSYWNITACEFYIRNATTRFNQTSCLYNGTNLNASLNFYTSNYTIIFSEAIYQINNTYNFTLTNPYNIQYQYTGRGSLKNLFNSISNFTGGGLDGFGRFLFGIIITLVVLGMIAQKTELRDTNVLIPSAILLTLIFSSINWYYIPYPMPNIESLGANWLNQYIVAVLITLLGVSYLVGDNF